MSSLDYLLKRLSKDGRPVETDMLKVIPEDRKTAIKSMVYLNRFAKPEEVAKAIVWLATECPEYINGTCLDINNGAFPR